MIDYKYGRFPKIKDVIPLTNGVFGHCDYVFPETIDVTKDQLDFLFMSSFARRNPAPVIDLLHDESLGEDDFSQLTDDELTQLANMMVAYYKPKWDKLGEIYAIEYDPIHNYMDDWEDEMDETREIDRTIDRTSVDTYDTEVAHSSTRTDNLSELESRNLTSSNTRTDNLSEEIEYGKTNTRTDDTSEETTYGKSNLRTDNLSKSNTGTQTNAGNSTDTNSVWGFNSATDPVNSDRNIGNTSNTRTDNLLETDTGTVADTLSGSDVTDRTGTVTDALTGSDTKENTGTQTNQGTEGGSVTTTNTGTQQTAGTDATTGTNTRDVDETSTDDEDAHRDRRGRHFGNIGNLTSQQMIREEIELWKWNYIQSILEDARDFLTLPVYM